MDGGMTGTILCIPEVAGATFVTFECDVSKVWMVDSISERVSLMVCNLIDTSDSVVDTIAAVDASVAVVEDVFV